MFSPFKTSHSPEVTSLINKHGINDALFIKTLGYFTNIDLNKVGEQGFITMSTGVRKITSDLKDPIGLTPTEYLILAFWSNHLQSAKVAFLTEHAHTIYETRGRTGPYSKHDLAFIRWTVDAIKRQVATTDTMMADLCTEHGDILDVEFEMRSEEGMKRLLTGNLEPPRDYIDWGESVTAREDVADPQFIQDEDMDKMTDPELISTLAGVDMAISRINAWKERLQVEKDRLDYEVNTLHFKKHFAKNRLKSLKEKRGYLKSLKR